MIPAFPHLLGGVRVLDASRVLAGPFCTQILGDLGADVVKVERPGAGDETRGWGPPFVDGLSAYFLSCNRNKRSLTLDLGRPEGAEVFRKLAERSDVVLENFRPSSAAKLGLGVARLHAANPRLIVGSISGFGRTGPLADEPGYDFAVQGMSGLMSITGPIEGPPSKVGVAAADIVTGLYAAIALLACLRAREKSGHGYAIDLSLLDCALAAQANVAQAFLSTGVVPPRQGNAHLQIVPYQTFRTLDDWIIVAVGNDGQFRSLCAVLSSPDLAADARFATNAERVRHRNELIPLLESLFRSRPASHWATALTQAQVPHAPIWNYAQLFDQDVMRARGMKIAVRDPLGKEIDLLASPIRVDGASPTASMPPTLGEHSEEILRDWLGCDPSQIEALRRADVV